MIEFIKALIRPFIIVWGLSTYTACLFNSVEMPELLTWLVGIIVLEYFGERAIKRLKE